MPNMVGSPGDLSAIPCMRGEWVYGMPSKNARSSQSVFLVYSTHDFLVSDILIPAEDVHMKIHLDANTTCKILVHSRKIPVFLDDRTSNLYT